VEECLPGMCEPWVPAPALQNKSNEQPQKTPQQETNEKPNKTKKGHSCYKVSKPILKGFMEVEFKNNELGYLAEEISKQQSTYKLMSVQSRFFFLFFFSLLSPAPLFIYKVL
jgi:hypothetical protein